MDNFNFGDFRTSVPVSSSSSLPIKEFKREILYLIERNSVVIVVGPTGSGKTTQIPQFLLEQGWTGIACTQPRRLSAMAMATRVNQEQFGVNERGIHGTEVGSFIGYSVRFDDCTSDKTICRFITDGMLFRQFLHDPLLSKYSVIIIDEAHERSLHTDLLLALIKKILPKRPDLRIVISSATIDAEAFKRYFTLPRIDNSTGKKLYGPLKPPEEVYESESINIKEFIPIERFEPKIISIEGRTFPVQIDFLMNNCSLDEKMIENDEIIIDAVVRLVEKINETEESGDVLVFLSGRNEIEKCFEKLQQRTSQRITAITNDLYAKTSDDPTSQELLSLFKSSRKKIKTGDKVGNENSKNNNFKLDILQLYSGMNSTDQMKIFEPTSPGYRKVILSTNISEASLTIEGIVFVIDSGRVKVRVFDSFSDKMVTIPCSKASADQRAGRAGRTRPGKTFRLYTKHFYETQMPRHTIPDLQLCKLTPIVLQLKAMHINNLIDFDFLSPPPERNLISALRDLKLLKALNDNNNNNNNNNINSLIEGGLSYPLGMEMAQLPLDPEIGHLFLKACEMNCPREGAALASMLTIQSQTSSSNETFFNFGPFGKFQRRFWVEEGDHLMLLNIFMSYLANSTNSVKFCQKYGLNLKNLITAHRLYTTLLTFLTKVFKKKNVERTIKMSANEISIIMRKCLISAYPLNVAKSDELRACYRSITEKISTSSNTFNSNSIHIHPNSILFKRLPPLIIYGQVLETTKVFIKNVTVIEAEWLEEIHPNIYKYQRRK